MDGGGGGGGGKRGLRAANFSGGGAILGCGPLIGPSNARASQKR